jgi:hypothetical protein
MVRTSAREQEQMKASSFVKRTVGSSHFESSRCSDRRERRGRELQRSGAMRDTLKVVLFAWRAEMIKQGRRRNLYAALYWKTRQTEDNSQCRENSRAQERLDYLQMKFGKEENEKRFVMEMLWEIAKCREKATCQFCDVRPTSCDWCELDPSWPGASFPTATVQRPEIASWPIILPEGDTPGCQVTQAVNKNKETVRVSCVVAEIWLDWRRNGVADLHKMRGDGQLGRALLSSRMKN